MGCKDRMVVFQGIAQLEALIGSKHRTGVAIFCAHFPQNAQKFLRRRLGRDPRGLKQKHKGGGASVHDRKFPSIHFDDGVIYAQPGQSRHQMFHCGQLMITAGQ